MKILTLTLSPALDVEYHANNAPHDGLVRANAHSLAAGGKGVNVSRAIRNCGASPDSLRTVVPLGGLTGSLFQSILEAESLPVCRVPIDAPTRINASLIPESGDPLEINAPGAPLGSALAVLEQTVLAAIDPGDVLVIAGSCPKDVDKAEPARLCRLAKEKGAIVAADADGDVLRRLLDEGQPDYIKPNRDELSALFGGRAISTPADAIAAAKAIVERGAVRTSVLVTLAGDGAAYVGADEWFVVTTEKRRVVRLKGAGDTFLGAFLYARHLLEKRPREAMQYAADVAGAYVAGGI